MTDEADRDPFEPWIELRKRIAAYEDDPTNGNRQALVDCFEVLKPKGNGKDSGAAAAPKKEEAKKPVIRTLSARLLAQQPIVPVSWIVEDLILEGALNGLFGDGATGKDLLLFQLAHCMAHGKKFLGMEVRQGKALYFNMEDSESQLRWRQAKLMAHLGIEEPSDNLLIVPMLGADSTLLAAFDARVNFVRKTLLYDSVCDLVAGFKPDLVVIGNRVNIFGVNQNDDAQARQCLGLLNSLIVKYGCTIIMPAHPSLHQTNTGEGSSGSVQWSNGVRQRLYFSRPKKDKDDDSAVDRASRTLEVLKSNYGPSGRGISMRWDDWCFKSENELLHVEAAANDETPRQAEKRIHAEVDAEFLRCLDKAAIMGMNLSPQPTSNNNPATLFAKDAAFNCKYRGGRGRKLLQESLGRLFAAKQVALVPYGKPSAGTVRIERRVKKKPTAKGRKDR